MRLSGLASTLGRRLGWTMRTDGLAAFLFAPFFSPSCLGKVLEIPRFCLCIPDDGVKRGVGAERWTVGLYVLVRHLGWCVGVGVCRIPLGMYSAYGYHC